MPRRFRPTATLMLAAAAMLSAAPPAAAHHLMGGAMPNGVVQGLLSGLGHPIIGLDHFAMLLAAGILAGLAGAPALLAAAFAGASLLGVAVHLARVTVPASELLVALTVVAAGVLLAARAGGLPRSVLAGLFACAGLLHGYAYGESIVGAEPTALWAYLAGLAAIQGALIAAVAAAVAGRFSPPSALPRTVGLMAATVGVVFLVLDLSALSV